MIGMRRIASGVVALAMVMPFGLAAVSAPADASALAGPAKSAAPALARAVADARTTDARVAAIDKIMAALHVDVINPANGAVVVPGAARSLNDAYLYTSEVRWLALGYAQRDHDDLTQLADTLDGVYPKLHVPMTEASLGGALLKVTAADATSSDPDSVALLPRLVWQLGLLDKPAQDLARPVPVSKIRLDPVQAWLVAAAFTLPLVYANPVPAHTASRLTALSEGIIARGLRPDNICDDLKPLKRTVTGSAQYVETAVLTALGKASWAAFLKTAGKYTAPLIDIVHLLITGIGIVVSSTVSPAETSLGGPPMNFAVSVSMTLKLPRFLVECGWLLGDDFPGQGPLSGVSVLWDNSELLPWGTISCDRAGCEKTGTDGAAREVFTPGPEEVHKGATVYEPGKVEALALPGSALGNKFIGTAFDLLRVQEVMRWEIKHHQTGWPTGFSLHATEPGWAGDPVEWDFTGSGKRQAGGQCDKTGCYLEIISGTVSGKVWQPKCPTATVPPADNLIGGISLAKFPSGAQVNQYAVDFHTVSVDCNGENYPYYVESKPSDSTKLPPYVYGEIHTTITNLLASGAVTITWKY